MTAFLRCEIFPSNLEATAWFYTRVLGFRITRDGRQDGIHYLALERGTVRLGAAYRSGPQQPDSRRPPIGVELVLEVDDLRTERERVAEAGWPVAEEIIRRPWGLEDFRVLDPDGYYWRLTTGAARGLSEACSSATTRPFSWLRSGSTISASNAGTDGKDINDDRH